MSVDSCVFKIYVVDNYSQMKSPSEVCRESTCIEEALASGVRCGLQASHAAEVGQAGQVEWGSPSRATGAQATHFHIMQLVMKFIIALRIAPYALSVMILPA